MKTNGNEPAQPTQIGWSESGDMIQLQTGNSSSQAIGLTKREHFAAMFLQSYLTGNTMALYNEKEMKAISDYAVITSDALIESLNKQS